MEKSRKKRRRNAPLFFPFRPQIPRTRGKSWHAEYTGVRWTPKFGQVAKRESRS